MTAGARRRGEPVAATPTRRALLGFAASALVARRAAADSEPALPWLSGLPVEGALPGAPPFALRLVRDEPGPLAEALTRPGLRVRKEVDAAVVTIEGYAPWHDEPAAARLRPTFLVDFDHPAFAPLLEELRAKHGAAPPPEALRDAVAAHVATKSYKRGYDVASEVVRRREGDCTEHAVLLTALLRAFGVPSRIVHGLLLLRVRGASLAGQHAWVEARVARAYRALDAAVSDGEGVVARLALHAVRNEGAGYGAEIAGRVQRLTPRRLVVLASEASLAR